MDTKKLEQEVKKYSGDDGEEIIEAIRKLAAVDVEINNSLDEIERIKDGLPEKHNELADQINDLVKKVCEKKEEEPSESDDSDAEGDCEKPERTAKKIVKVEVHVVKTPPMPLALMALMDFLNS